MERSERNITTHDIYKSHKCKSKGGRAGESYKLYDCISTKFPKRQKESTVLKVRIVLPSGKKGGSDAGERYQGVGEGLNFLCLHLGDSSRGAYVVR